MQPVTRLIAIRHGETAWNVDNRIQGHLDIALNDTGVWQADRAAQALAHEPVAAIYSSDLLRAWATAQAIAKSTTAPLLADAGLRERCFGSFEGRTFSEIELQAPEQALRWRKREPDFVPEGGGESLSALHVRIERTVQAIAARHLGCQIVVVTHGGVLDVLYRLATRQSVQAPRTWQLGNASIHRLLWNPDSGLTLVGWADMRHLDAPSRDEAAAA